MTESLTVSLGSIRDSIQDTLSNMAEKQRFRERKRRRDEDSADYSEDDLEDRSQDQITTNSKTQLSSTRRGRAGTDKRFVCNHDSCGKSYSRAEHLHRHQLNHAPKQIFQCDFPGCSRTFVRQDLCIRHRERHTQHDGQAQGSLTPLRRSKRPSPHSVPSDEAETNFDNPTPKMAKVLEKPLPQRKEQTSTHRPTIRMTRTSTQPPAAGRNGSDEALLGSPTLESHRSPNSASPITSVMNNERRFSFDTSSDRFQDLFTGILPNGEFSLPALRASSTQMKHLTSMPSPDASSTSRIGQSGFSQIASPDFAIPYDIGQKVSTTTSLTTMNATGLSKSSSDKTSNFYEPLAKDQSMAAPRSTGVNSTSIDSSPATDNLGTRYSFSGFDEHGYGKSPNTIGAEFTAWLFNENNSLQNNFFAAGPQPSMAMMNFSSDDFGGGLYSNYFADPALNDVYPNMVQQEQQQPLPMPMYNSPGSVKSENSLFQAKRHGLIELMERRFNDDVYSADRQLREEIFEGNLDSIGHVLSARSIQLYIDSYWYHFHAQLPILHKPTFSFTKTHDYLLLAVMAIGASCLDKALGQTFTDAASKLANFIASNLRWQVFGDVDFHPPAKLWVFQTLLLLDIYEKRHSTRRLHERAHIHFATTLTLMRRCHAMIGKSGYDTPSARKDQGPGGEVSYISPEEWWNQWITAEATRRAAFAAFILDATHATMFGHAATMVVHEIRLPLPCDEALWSATSSGEVGRVEASLHANGIKQTTFLDGLKNLLNARKVQTNPFGRVILMAGLLSLSWHMQQRDLQGSTLGVRQVGLPEGWRDPLTRAFDFWKRDFDQSLAHLRSSSQRWPSFGGAADEQNTAEASGMALHHLSHMSMHTTAADCQMYAGARGLLARPGTQGERERIKLQMAKWVQTAGARAAVFHSLKFMRKILLSSRAEERNNDGDSNGHHHSMDASTSSSYSARDDFHLIRPWVLYFGAMIVWSYGFALDGPLKPFPSHLFPPPVRRDSLSKQESLELGEACFKDAKEYLTTVGGVRSPDGLQMISTGRNKVVGLLAVVRKAFEASRWELLSEGAENLRRATEMLKGEES